jgi:Tfp pilus assembly protein PilF
MIRKDKIDFANEEFERAFSFQNEGKIDEAIKAYKNSIIFFATAKAHTYLGWALSLQGKFEEAIEECHSAISLDPDYGNPYNDIGSYLISLGRHEEAFYWLKLAIDAPHYVPRHYPYFNLGLIHEKKGDWFTARQYYNQAIELNPNYEDAKTGVIRITALLN